MGWCMPVRGDGEGRCHVEGVVCVLCETMMGVEGGWLGRYSLFV